MMNGQTAWIYGKTFIDENFKEIKSEYKFISFKRSTIELGCFNLSKWNNFPVHICVDFKMFSRTDRMHYWIFVESVWRDSSIERIKFMADTEEATSTYEKRIFKDKAKCRLKDLSFQTCRWRFEFISMLMSERTVSRDFFMKNDQGCFWSFKHQATWFLRCQLMICINRTEGVFMHLIIVISGKFHYQCSVERT